MWIQALLTSTELEVALAELLPMKVLLDGCDPNRYLRVEKPSLVVTTHEGMRLTTSACLQWDVIGIKVPLVMRHVALTLIPSIEPRDGQDTLVLSLRLDEADLSGMPEFVETSLLKRVNNELAKERARIVWEFTHTLDFNFSLPERIVGTPRVRLFAHQGAAKMSDEGIVIAARFRVERVDRDTQEASHADCAKDEDLDSTGDSTDSSPSSRR